MPSLHRQPIKSKLGTKNGETITTQTNAIILRFQEKHTAEFERMFKDEVVPLWRKFKKEGKFLNASLTPVTGGWSPPKGQRYYILHVEVPSMEEHEEFDSDPVFTRFLEKARRLQAEEPYVWLGETLYQV